jgi:hypothetical protein
MLVLMLAAGAAPTPAQAAATPVAASSSPAASPATPPHLYLHPTADGCDRSAKDEVVVCADKDADKRYRLQPIDNGKYADRPIRAETRIAGGVLGIAGGQTSVGGFPSNRIMLNFKIKF